MRVLERLTGIPAGRFPLYGVTLMPGTDTEYVCPRCSASVSFNGRAQAEPPVCYRCHDWPDMEPREIRPPSPLLVSDEVPSHLRDIDYMMRHNGEVHP